MAKTYADSKDSCKACGRNVKRLDNDECATCNPYERKEEASEQASRRKDTIRLRIEEHQHREDTY